MSNSRRKKDSGSRNSERLFWKTEAGSGPDIDQWRLFDKGVATSWKIIRYCEGDHRAKPTNPYVLMNNHQVIEIYAHKGEAQFRAADEYMERTLACTEKMNG